MNVNYPLHYKSHHRILQVQAFKHIQRCHSSGLNRNSVFCFNPFFPGRPFIKRPEEKKGNGNLLLFFFLSLESATYDSMQRAQQ